MKEYCGNFRHEHPLVPMNEEQISNQSEEAKCWMCGEKVSTPCFSCSKCHGFYVHKLCAEAPSEINHHFHGDHPLVLLDSPPSFYDWCSCNFCNGRCERFVYHCSCHLDFHIKCALFTYNFAEENLKELEHVGLEDPLISTEKDGKELEDLSKCFVCWEALTNYTYFSLDCGYNLYKKCVELPFKINLNCHRKHPLILQFNCKGLSCKSCHFQQSPIKGFVYGCSLCKFAVHLQCFSLPLKFEDTSHQHSFTLFRRRAPFVCDACGSEGNYVAYICCGCNIIVHKRCISLPRIIKSKWHDDHRIFHNYFLEEEDFESWDCIICHEKVNAEFGSYSCLDCKFIFHVNCVIKEEDSYFVVSLENEDEPSESLELSDLSSITCVFRRNDAGEATEIKHFLHVHNLMLGEKNMEDDKSCDGCMLPISDSFYYCPQCDFLLHKACAKLPKSNHVWHHCCRKPLMLTSGKTFRCEECDYQSNVFAYTCVECERHACLRCIIALTPGVVTSPKHEHPLIYYKEYEGKCSACGVDMKGAFLCKDCKFNFALDHRCFSLPTVARHKCDEHLLALTYHDDNTNSESHYCDICEERRDPNRWFYHCATCDTSAHVKCVLGQHPFFKLGGFWRIDDHPHSVTVIRKIYDYPNCIECNKPCKDLALECTVPGCNYIIHWEC